LAVIFTPRADLILRRVVLEVAVAAGLFIGAWYYYTYPQYTRVGYQPVQPVPFSHAQHVGQLGLDCRYCHQFVAESPHANVPSVQTCMNCHNPEKANVKGNSPLLQPVRDAWASARAEGDPGRAVPWKQIHKTPEYAYYNHAVHVNRGVSCVSCHGPVNEMAVVYQAHPLHMQFCLDCHRHPEQHLRPSEEVYNLNWKPPAGATQLEIGAAVREKYAIRPPQTCQACHR
jgi:hypothetical protein